MWESSVHLWSISQLLSKCIQLNLCSSTTKNSHETQLTRSQCVRCPWFWNLFFFMKNVGLKFININALIRRKTNITFRLSNQIKQKKHRLTVLEVQGLIIFRIGSTSLSIYSLCSSAISLWTPLWNSCHRSVSMLCCSFWLVVPGHLWSKFTFRWLRNLYVFIRSSSGFSNTFFNTSWTMFHSFRMCS